ncbi:hypothetical protein SMC26_29975 [Actinomadura fulvescens]|uniref:Uncharacterized protein n=1 Tax=Actinomadura fulvescens TaxID=46160 RepID=A0ABP6BLS2_9ACTN
MAVWRSVQAGGDTKKSRHTLALPQLAVEQQADQTQIRHRAGELFRDQGLDRIFQPDRNEAG